ncbi:MAG: FAD-binding protein [Betaproteobacteria bacterium]|nr:FAD-binding protein [Betaproteobacteria bacterium]
MNASSRIGDSRLAERLRREIEGEVLFDAASRGRYSTDASIYQVEPVGVVVPKTRRDVEIALQIAREEKIPVLPRGGGTSQCGQTVGCALVIDNSKHLNRVVAFDREARRVSVEPGLVLDQLNAYLKPHGLFYPVDVSTSAQATLGGMSGNNSCGARSLRYGNMVHNVREIEAWLATGELCRFGDVPEDAAHLDGPARYREIVAQVQSVFRREAAEIEARFPRLQRRVGGYNLDSVSAGAFNMAKLLVGSEGTLAFFREISLDLQPVPPHKVLGVCHFQSFYQAMDCTRHIVALEPAAVELVDRTMIELSRDIPAFRGTVERSIRGEPEAILLVEFAGEDRDEQVRRLKQLTQLMGDLGFPGSVSEVLDAAFQRDIWEVRKAGLNIMMSMKGDGKPVSFIEDCAVPLEHLADYTERLTRVFEKHGTRGTWYAHASVGCLHVRPVLNMKTDDGPRKMRAIAEEAAAMVREYKGSYSGEHGDGLVRSEWIEPMFGSRLARAFEEIKDAFDPEGLMNPGKIVRPPKMDNRTLFRFKPGYRVAPIATTLDWSEWGGFGGAIEMCNNNGACRKFDAGVMCPSYRATLDERHLTRGRANTLRLAVSGQLGRDAFTSDELFDTLDLCVSCKGCKRECPTGVDMARMKIEFLHHYYARHGLPLKERLVAYLPRYAPWAARLAPLLNLRNRVPWLAALMESVVGFARQRSLPEWRRDYWRSPRSRPEAGPVTPPPRPSPLEGEGAGEVVLLADTFNRYFEPENLHAAISVLEAGGYRVHCAEPADGGRPLCCGRTFLAAGQVNQARAEARRMIEALGPFVARGVPVVGLEPSCLFTLRDEFKAMLPGPETDAVAANALLFEEFLAREQAAGRLNLPLKPLAQRVLLHGHCHQKAFGAMPAVLQALKLVPELQVEAVESSCCGMAGAFGFEARHYDVSMKMGETSLLPKVRAAAPDTLIVADGVSCRHQIADGTHRQALHVARILSLARG